MSEVLTEVGQLSRMRQELSPTTIESLKGQSGKFAARLEQVAEKTFTNNKHVRGTSISRPSLLTYGRRGRLVETITPSGFGMFVREIPTPEGRLVMFPLHTLGLSGSGTPIIEPGIKDSYTVLHIPNTAQSDRHNPYNPAGMIADLVFTTDKDNLVTVHGQNPVTAEEYALFDSIVNEFERLADLS